MSAPHLQRDYAASLLSDLQLSSAASLPRREAIGDWLNDFIKPARAGERAGDPETVPNLLAINAHFLAHAVSRTVRPVLG